MRRKVIIVIASLISICFTLSRIIFFCQLNDKPKISKDGDVNVVSEKSDDVKASAGTSAEDRRCSAKDHVVYIKTRKTGSTTAAHIFWRYALRRNLTVLTFSRQHPFPNSSFIPFILDSHPSLHKLSHFDIAADHMIYNKQEFRQVMPKDTVYISSLRELTNQFKSAVNYFGIPNLFNITTSDPASTLLQHLDYYTKNYLKGLDFEKGLQNPSAVMLGLRTTDFQNQSAVRQFIRNIVADFDHILITEHLDESLIVVRRKLCWEMIDILYLPRLTRNYNYKNTQLRPDLVGKLTNWSRVDAMLYKIFNETLWKSIAQYGEDFWNELKFYKNQKLRIQKFCSPVLNYSEKYFNVSNLDDNILVPESPWGNEFKIDRVWCMVNQISEYILKSTFKLRNFPELCNLIKSKLDFDVELHPDQCSGNETSSKYSFQLPLAILMKKYSYMQF